jgi:hypothetical protein
MTGNFDKSDSSYWDGYCEKMKEREPRQLQSPILRPGHFPALWEKVTKAVKTGGRFAGQFFGVNDTWAYRKDMIFHTGEQVRALFADFEIESFHEQDEEGEATTGPKHWHVFTVIARKI